MADQAPSIDSLRAAAALQGVHPDDADLIAVQGFLSVLLPAFEGLDELIPDGTVPAGMFVPTDDA
ncbi:MAG: hypothetical protein ACR2OD_01205 [Gaiellaceae bacterium]